MEEAGVIEPLEAYFLGEYDRGTVQRQFGPSRIINQVIVRSWRQLASSLGGPAQVPSDVAGFIALLTGLLFRPSFRREELIKYFQI